MIIKIIPLLPSRKRISDDKLVAMGSTKAMEDSLATASTDVYRPPTLQPGLGAPRCPRCAAPLSKDLIGTAVGGTVSAFYGFNHVIPPICQWITRPKWLQFAAGLPPVMLLSIGCAGLAGGALPSFAQLAVSSYHAASAASHSAISQVTMQIEGRGELQSFATNSGVQPSVTEKG